MKNLSIYRLKRLFNYATVLFSVCMVSPSCTANFEKMNTDPNGVTDEELMQDNNYIGMHFPLIEKSIYWNKSGNGWEFQLIQNLTSDVWSGYIASPTNFKGGINTQTYAITNDWSDYAWHFAYTDVMPNQMKVSEKCEEMGYDSYGHFYAINSILRVLAMHRVCDEYGPIIYTHFGESKTGGIYDSAQQVYRCFFHELAEANELLNYFITQEEYASFEKFDLSLYHGDLTKWLRLSNSLRLRLAMRIVKYDEEWAREEAEEAIMAPGGLMREGDIFQIEGGGWLHPLYTCSREFKDMFINANVQSILGGYEDPRLARFGIMNDGRVVGMRSGVPGLENTSDKYKALVSPINVEAASPGVIMTSAETYFLLAEAALRGWKAGGSAKEFYEDGIRTSFLEFGVPLGNYLESSRVPSAWEDPLVEVFNEPAASHISPRWEDAKSDEERLEKIITQKWIAGFPEGKNAWAEYRRTGYPKLFPVLKNDSQGEVSTLYGVRRLPFTTAERTNNKLGYAEAVEYLDGEDNAGTRLFWDINKGNFE